MDQDRVVHLTEEQLKQLLSEAVTEAFLKLGVDATDPLEMQKDFLHLREWREATDALQKRGLMVILATLVAGGMAALWLGFKDMINM